MNDLRDTLRQIIVLISALLAVAGAFVGSGAAGGTAIQNASGGALASDATALAPGGAAFAIWTPIYAGLLAYAVWQSMPAQKSDPRQLKLGFPIAGSLLLNAVWILSIQLGYLAASVPIILLLLAVLVWTFTITLGSRPRSVVETIVVDGTIGLYLGWVCVATAANVTAFLSAAGFRGFGLSQDPWAVLILLIAGAVGILIAVRGRGRLTPAISLSWGLAWIAVARLTGSRFSTATAITAILVAVIVLGFTLLVRVRSGRSIRSRDHGSVVALAEL